jgi:hypothetical protein
MGDSDPMEQLSPAEELPQDHSLEAHEPFQDWVPNEPVGGSGNAKKRR